MNKSSNKQTTIPENLVPFRAVSKSQIKQIVKSMLNGTYDQQKEDYRINMAIYKTLDKYQKPHFKKMFLEKSKQVKNA
jgi:hypothetical protein